MGKCTRILLKIDSLLKKLNILCRIIQFNLNNINFPSSLYDDLKRASTPIYKEQKHVKNAVYYETDILCRYINNRRRAGKVLNNTTKELVYYTNYNNKLFNLTRPSYKFNELINSKKLPFSNLYNHRSKCLLRIARLYSTQNKPKKDDEHESLNSLNKNSSYENDGLYVSNGNKNNTKLFNNKKPVNDQEPINKQKPINDSNNIKDTKGMNENPNDVTNNANSKNPCPEVIILRKTDPNSKETCTRVQSMPITCNRIDVCPVADKIDFAKKEKLSKVKTVAPKNKLYKFRPLPVWKSWVYSMLGIDVSFQKAFPPKIRCNKPFSKEELEFKWRGTNNYPKAYLGPSIKHYDKVPEERLLIKRFKDKAELQQYSKHLNEEKKLFAESLPAINKKKILKGKRSADIDKHKTSTNDKLESQSAPKLVANDDGDKICIKKSALTIEVMQKSTSEFCKALMDLVEISEDKVSKKKEKKVNRVSHVTDKKLRENEETLKTREEPLNDIKKSFNNTEEKIRIKNVKKRKGKNSLETNEEFKKRKQKGIQMPKHYCCGAGDIERMLIEARKGQHSEAPVYYKYRDVCKKKPGEEIIVE